MSEQPKIQDAPAPEAGAQKPLSPDAAAGRTRGFDGDQNSLSYCRGVEVASSSQTSVRGYSVSGREQENARHVDQRCIEGSYAGDSRAKGADAKLPNNPGPRQGMSQTPNGRNCQSAPAPQSFPADADSDAGN